MSSIIGTVTTSTTDGILAHVGNLFTDLLPLIILVVGLPLGFWIIRKVINLVKAR